MNRTSFLPDIVRERVGFATDRDAFRRDAQSRLGHRTLAGANDKSLGFEETAAHIEKVDIHLMPEAGSVLLEGEASRSAKLGPSNRGHGDIHDAMSKALIDSGI